MWTSSWFRCRCRCTSSTHLWWSTTSSTTFHSQLLRVLELERGQYCDRRGVLRRDQSLYRDQLGRVSLGHIPPLSRGVVHESRRCPEVNADSPTPQVWTGFRGPRRAHIHTQCTGPTLEVQCTLSTTWHNTPPTVFGVHKTTPSRWGPCLLLSCARGPTHAADVPSKCTVWRFRINRTAEAIQGVHIGCSSTRHILAPVQCVSWL